ncbi:MAG: putative RHO family GTPase [Streblomastix strix]|uniref:Putative RHO family GTPase n=1 Tax=Streblomastix strix TaxID=222440 RepID=A0A5J4URT2_9EUKA|nr:MAG: putative RHO family GTPase [Streblomastix strix]
MSDEKDYKLATIGDVGVGKTSLLVTYTMNTFPSSDSIPTVFDEFDAMIFVDGKAVKLTLNDWFPEIQHDYFGKPVFLIGTKSELRSQGGELVTTKQAEDLVKKLKFSGYFECSAMTKDNLDNTFGQIARKMLSSNSKSTSDGGKSTSDKKCIIQ